MNDFTDLINEKIGNFLGGAVRAMVLGRAKPKPDPMVKVFEKAFTVAMGCGVVTTIAYAIDKTLTTKELNRLKDENESLKKRL